MKSIILYGSLLKLSNGHRLVTQPPNPKYYVRTQMFRGDVDTALNKAKPRRGEIVLNTAPVGD